MKQVTVTVVDPVGLHARPATVAVNAASKFKSEINVAFKGREVNMKSHGRYVFGNSYTVRNHN